MHIPLCGMRVLVPLGKKEAVGIVLCETQSTDIEEEKIKPIIATLDSIPAATQTQLLLWQWISDYYISPLDKDGRMHYRRALNLLMKLKKTMPDVMPPWSLSIQMHKVIGAR